jgi:hypothetical protein
VKPASILISQSARRSCPRSRSPKYLQSDHPIDRAVGIGAPDYMAPEWTGTADARADIYPVWSSTRWSPAGCPSRPTPAAVLIKHLPICFARKNLVDLPEVVEQVLFKALKDQNRFQTMKICSTLENWNARGTVVGSSLLF